MQICNDFQHYCIFLIDRFFFFADYDGLWVGGHRNRPGNNWTWIGSENHDELPVPTSSIVSAYPEWYKTDKVLDDSLKNCLVFERTGHNLPILVPTDCKMKKPFVCSRIGKTKQFR